MKLSSFMEVSSSPEYATEFGLKFAPQLAIQAAASDKWANCFVSRKMKLPWFKLRFKSVTSIFNVRLGVRDQPGGNVPADFNLTGMASLSVYVSNSSTLEKKNLCGSKWIYKSTKIIDFTCLQRKLYGYCVHIMVPSSVATYLIICGIILNKDDGKWTVQHRQQQQYFDT